MILYSIRFLFAIFLFSTAAICVNAQTGMPDASGRTNQTREDLPKNVKETLAKNRIEREEKEYQELVSRTDEAAQLSDQIQNSFTKHNKLTGEDRKKLERLEKLVKKIRKDLGGDDGEIEEENPSDLFTAVETLQENSLKLVEEIKKSTRYSISVGAIEKTNQILRILQFIHGRQN